VICSNVGGTKELIKIPYYTFGSILREQHPFTFEKFDYDLPPYIDVTQYNGLDQKVDSIHQQIIAKQYEKILQENL
jgi:hypothetical protein